MTTVLLVGSGISLDAGMPSVAGVNEQVLSGRGAVLRGGTFRIHAQAPSHERERTPVEQVLGLLADLRNLATSYWGRDPSYEELAFIAREVHDTLAREYENPATILLIERLATQPYAGGSAHRLQELGGLCREYIADTVVELLNRPASRLDHLNGIIEACAGGRVSCIATLNHDLVLEAALDQSGIDYADGFEGVDADVRLWTDEWVGSGLRLLKLHGSIDWWDYKVTAEPERGWVPARVVTGGDPCHPVRTGLGDGPPRTSRPTILTGTYDKILAYESGVFSDQHLRFNEALRGAARVVGIGYGFGDKAINSRVINWLARGGDRRLVLCHPDPEALRRKARNAIRNNWDGWRAHDQLGVVPCSVADLDYRALAAQL